MILRFTFKAISGHYREGVLEMFKIQNEVINGTIHITPIHPIPSIGFFNFLLQIIFFMSLFFIKLLKTGRIQMGLIPLKKYDGQLYPDN